ncbi:hypothetical protein [uncultured Algibacter sp.]|uniref:hypothetical protein n=1 Tax=uncultured Algibacter sp. TaxID=298659 RepID=UPI00321691DB
MRTIIFISCFIFCFLSCSNKKKYEGQWTNSILKDSGNNETRNVIIEKDSIKFNHPYFDFYNTYALKIEKDKFNFNNIILKASIEKDTLTLNDSIYFIRDNKNTLSDSKPLLKIDLPQVSQLKNTIKYSNDDLINYIYFGKRLDNGKFSLQLNDKYAEISELPEFLNYSRISRREEIIPFRSTYLLVDKTTPMRYLEDIFFNLKLINQLKVCFVNNIYLKHNDSKGIYYEYERLMKRLPHYRELDHYKIDSSYQTYTAPPPPPYFPRFDNKRPNTKLILLKNNNTFIKDSLIEFKNLKSLIKPLIKNANTILSLYDLESTYDKFLELNTIIDSVYQVIREEHSKIKFNKCIDDLTQDELTEVKIERPMYHIWAYSIPHYNSIIEKEDTFYGLKLQSIK